MYIFILSDETDLSCLEKVKGTTKCEINLLSWLFLMLKRLEEQVMGFLENL